MNRPTGHFRSWDERAKAYAERSDLLLQTPEQRRQWTTLLQTLLDGQSGGDVLDVGTGPGFLALQLAQLGYRTTGVDSSTEMLRIAARFGLPAPDSGFSRQGAYEKIILIENDFHS